MFPNEDMCFPKLTLHRLLLVDIYIRKDEKKEEKEFLTAL